MHTHRLLTLVIVLCSLSATGQVSIPAMFTPVTADFSGFAGQGFVPSPVLGFLDSDNWSFTGFSDGDLAFGGGAGSGGDYGRGITSGGVSTGGIYALDNGGNRAIWFQPDETDLTPGAIIYRLQNNTGSTITDLSVSYELLVLNDGDRMTNGTVSWSANAVSYTSIPSLNFTTAAAMDVAGISTETRSALVTGMSIGNGQFIYLRWEIADGTGTGNRDEFGFDDITVEGRSDNSLFGPQQVISLGADNAQDVFAADLDGDGDMDVLSASANDDEIAWYENLGGGTFGAQQIITSSADGAWSVFAADLDGDGDMDVLSASSNDDKIAWYQNFGGGAFGPQNIISSSANEARDVSAFDLDGDGDMDVLSASSLDDKIAWYQNFGGGAFGPQIVITTSANGAYSAYATDYDNDGDLDVVSASRFDNWVAKYENFGSGAFGPRQLINNSYSYPTSVYAADLDKDGDQDLVSALFNSDRIAWYQNTGTGTFSFPSLLPSSANGANDVIARDINGDGNVDILFASLNDNKVGWYRNLGAGTFSSQYIITNSSSGPTSVFSVDLDGDGDFDILSSSQYDDKIAWYENLSGLYCESASFTTCPSDTIIDVSFNIPVAVNYDLPGALEICCPVNIFLTEGLASGEDFPVGTTIISYIADDGIGAPDTCTFSVTVDFNPCTGPDEFEKTYGYSPTTEAFQDIVSLPDNGFFLSGNSGSTNNDLYLVRTDCAGDTIWSTVISSPAPTDLASSAVLKPDNKMWVVGGQSSDATAFTDGVILEVDHITGLVLDATYYGGTANDYLLSIGATAEGGAVIGGLWGSFGTEDAWLMKLDSLGDTIFNSITDYGFQEKINYVEETITGNIFAAGRQQTVGGGLGFSRSMVLYFDEFGNEIWSVFGPDDVDWFDGTVADDGGFTVTGRKRNSGTGSLLAVAKYNVLGVQEWYYELGDATGPTFGGSVIKNGSGYLIAGRRSNPSGGLQGWLLELDDLGLLVSDELYGDSLGVSFLSDLIVINADSNVVLSGRTETTPGNQDAWLIKDKLPPGFCSISDYALAQDTVSMCGNSVALDAGLGFSAYEWNTGLTAQVLTVTQSGIYSVVVTDGQGCTGTDSLQVSLVNLSISASSTNLCGSSAVDLQADGEGDDSWTYLWSSGETTMSISPIITATSYVSVAVSDGITNCVDSLLINVEVPVPVTFATCPLDIEVISSTGDSVIVNYVTPTANDNCSGVTVSLLSGSVSGSAFPIGNTAVSYLAIDGIGQSDTCNFIISVVPDCPVPTVLGASTSTSSAVLTWSTSPFHQGFQIKGRRLGDAFFASVITTSVPFSVGGLSPSTSYEWKVKAKCFDGTITASSVLNTFTTTTLKLSGAEKTIHLAPNPAFNILRVSWPENSEPLILMVSDLMGREILKIETPKANYVEINVQNYPAGQYFIQFSGEDFSAVKKFTVSK